MSRIGFTLAVILGVVVLGGSYLSFAQEQTPTSSPSSSASPVASPSAGGVELEMVDIAFKPKEITIPANTDVTITLKNTGAAVHNFSVTDHKNEGKTNLNISVNVQPGQTGTAKVNAPAGDYYFFCDQPGHEAAGMFGTLHVK